ncbi:MAG: hypothetical protein DI589_06660 [Shinella sp.]|nr:MAG: hypothetical protein DI589_06660 [Shinella sp.]
MAKKGKSDEKGQTEAGPLAGEPPVAETGGAPGADAVVDGGGGAAAGAGGAEHPDGAEAPLLEVADAELGEAASAPRENDAADAASEEGRPEAVPDAPVVAGAASEGVSDDADISAKTDGIDSAGPDALVVSQPDTDGGEQNGTGGAGDTVRIGEDVRAGTELRSGPGDKEPDGGADCESDDDEDADYCIACGKILVDGDAVYHDVSEGGYLHADCCGPERESYVNADGEPLKEGEPIPEPDIYQRARPVPGGNAGDVLDAGGFSAVDGSAYLGDHDAGNDANDPGDGSASGIAVDLPVDMIVEAAKAAANEALRFVVGYWMLPDATMAQCHVLFGAYSTAAPAMAELVRKIGPERATIEVVASQLKIMGSIDDVDLHPAVRMAITVFLQALVAIEAFEATERALAEAKWAKTMVERKPLLIEDTTLEPVSGPLDTW